MIDLKPILDFLAPFRDLWLKKLEPKPQIPLEKRIEYLCRIEREGEGNDPTLVGALTRELFGVPIRGDLLQAIWQVEGDRVWMIEKYLSAGGERTFRWDEGSGAIHPIPVGMDVPPFGSMNSFEDVRRSATNRAVVSLALNAVAIPVGLAWFKAFVDKAPGISGIVTATILASLGAIMILATLGGAIRDEARYKAANAFWAAWTAATAKDGKFPNTGTRASRNRTRYQTTAWVHWVFAMTMAILVLGIPIFLWIKPFIDRFLVILPIVLFLTLNILSTIKWKQLRDSQAPLPHPVWMRVGTMVLTIIGLSVLAQFAGDLLRATNCGYDWVRWVEFGGVFMVAASNLVNGWFWTEADRRAREL